MTFIAPHYSKAKKQSPIGFFKKDHYLVKTPWWLKKIFPGCLWDIETKDKTLYLSFDDGSSWRKFQLNLPEVPVTDLIIKDNDLVVATQGRAFWDSNARSRRSA